MRVVNGIPFDRTTLDNEAVKRAVQAMWPGREPSREDVHAMEQAIAAYLETERPA
jgi:hypothetical protein